MIMPILMRYPPEIHSVRAHYSVKTKKYKLMHFYEDGHWEMYDTENDPTEMNNLYGTEGSEALTAELLHTLKQLQSKYQVPEEHKRQHNRKINYGPKYPSQFPNNPPKQKNN